MDEPMIYIPEILPVNDDLVFKRVLTHPDAKPVLRFVTSALLNRTVTDVTVLSNEPTKEDINAKNEHFDVNCRVENGDKIAMEMQADPMKGDSSKNDHHNIIIRAVFGMADLFASQQAAGLAYSGFLKSYQTTFLGYTVFPERKRFDRRILLRDDEGVELTDYIGIIFLELTKLNEVLKKSAKEMSRLEAWLSFMVTADKLQYKDKVRELIKEWEELRVAYDLLTSISQNENDRAVFRSRRMAMMTRNTELEYVKAEGRKDGRLEAAIDAILDGISKPSTIAKIGGFNEEKAIELINQYSQEENKLA